jgi:hypothetical protein
MIADKERGLQHNVCVCVYVIKYWLAVSKITYAGDVSFTDTYNMVEILNKIQNCGQITSEI